MVVAHDMCADARGGHDAAGGGGEEDFIGGFQFCAWNVGGLGRNAQFAAGSSTTCVMPRRLPWRGV